MPDYTTSSAVANLLQVTDFSSTTKPTNTQVETIIERKEDEIDHRTKHAWRSVSVSNEMHDILFDYYESVGIPIFLKHRKVRTFDTDEGDQLEIWNGSEWEDWITDKTEGRDEDFWVNYDEGIIYLVTHYYYKRKLLVRVTYRYGESTVPKDIEDACTKMAAIDVLQSEDWSIRLPEGTAGIPYSERVRKWQEDVDRILMNRTEVSVPYR